MNINSRKILPIIATFLRGFCHITLLEGSLNVTVALMTDSHAQTSAVLRVLAELKRNITTENFLLKPAIVVINSSKVR